MFSCACLYLAGKVEDTPKSVRDVLFHTLHWRFRGDSVDALRRKVYSDKVGGRV